MRRWRGGGRGGIEDVGNVQSAEEMYVHNNFEQHSDQMSSQYSKITSQCSHCTVYSIIVSIGCQNETRREEFVAEGTQDFSEEGIMLYFMCLKK